MFFFNLKSPFIIKVFLSSLAGFLLAYSQPGSPAQWTVWIAPAPLMLLWHICRTKESSAYSFFTGFLFFGTVHLWGNVFGWEVWLAMTIYQSLFLAATGAAASLLLHNLKEDTVHKIIVPAICWTAGEHIKSLGPLGVNWGSLSYCHCNNIPILQLAGITGMYGLTFITAGVSSSLAITAKMLFTGGKKNMKAAISIIALLILPLIVYISGLISICLDRQSDFRIFKAGIIQPGFDMITKKDPRRGRFIVKEQLRLASECAKENPQIIIWPETSIPGIFPNPYQEEFMKQAAIESGCDMIFGAVRSEDGKEFNSAIITDKKGSFKGIYSKRHLVPFGEYLPIPDKLRSIHPMMSLIPSLSPGTDCRVFKSGTTDFGIIICFESDFPQYAREETQKGASFIAAITNDGWFEHYSAAEHHAAWNSMRAAENHIPIIQAANSGISMLASSDGKIIKRIELFNKGYMAEDIKISRAGTFYTHTGNWIMLICYAYLIILIFAAAKNIKSAGKLRKKEAKNEKDS